jgi:hypothetical protein
MKPAHKIKAELIEFIIKNNFENYSHSSVLVDEMPFLGRNRFADISLIHNQIIGFEIKSHADSIDKLEDQIRDYQKIFDKVYLIVDEKFKNKVDYISKKVGIIIYNKELSSFKVKRSAKVNITTKEDIALLISKKYFTKTIENKGLSISDIRNIEIKKTKHQLKNNIIESLYNKYDNIEYNLANSIF